MAVRALCAGLSTLDQPSGFNSAITQQLAQRRSVADEAHGREALNPRAERVVGYLWVATQPR